jgi:ABC-type glycerol-3-phosphate transport system substrate-binding protein
MGAVVLGLALAVAGCSSDKPSTSATPTTTPVAGGNPATTDSFCTFVRTFNERFGRIDPSLSDPAQLRTRLQEATKAVTDAAATAPAAVKADVGVLGQAYTQLLAVFQQAGFDVAKVPLASLQAFQAPAFAQASARLDAYRAANCP